MMQCIVRVAVNANYASFANSESHFSKYKFVIAWQAGVIKYSHAVYIYSL